MGMYRFFLAIFVAISHIGISFNFYGYKPGVVAVISFFLLSGYVMFSLIEKYYKDPFDVKGFYLDRAARLFPQYIFYFLLASMCIHFFNLENEFITNLTFSKWLLNIPILPLGYYMFWGADALVISQAWSLGLEMSFYLVVPWIVRYFNIPRVTILLIASIYVFLAAYSARIHSDWFGYRLLPGTLFMFLVGAFFQTKERIYHIYITLIFLLSGALFLLAYLHKSLYALPFNKEVLLGLLIGIPSLAILRKFKYSTFDELLGSLSYGVFLNHAIVCMVIDKFLLINDKNIRALVIIFISSLLAFVSYFLVEIPALKWRHTLRTKKIKSGTFEPDARI